MSPAIRVFVLGSPRITYGATPLSIKRLQFRALIFRLAAQIEPVSRDELAYLFWPDVADAQARRHLTQVLSHVRRTLPELDLITTTRSHVQLDRSRVWTDVADFTQLCSHPNEASTESLGQAIRLYRGPLLEGVSLPDLAEYETWLVGARHRIERLYLEGLDILAARFSERNEYQRAIELTTRYLTIDVLAEEMHRRLIGYYGAIGDRHEAMRQYRRCVVLLDRDLGVEPLPETEAVYQAVLAGDSPPDVTSEKRTSILSVAPGIPLVGRNHLLRELTTVFQSTRSGQGRVVLLSGEAGSGKSRLMQEFVRQVSEDANTLSAACHRPMRSIPYHPIVEAIRPALASPQLARNVPASWLGIATGLFPELPDLYPDISLPADRPLSPQSHGQIYEALRRLILGLADHRSPLLLCLDDLQWADAMSLNWLSFLAQELPRSPVMAIGTYRSEDVQKIGALRLELGRQGTVKELRLNGLDRDEVQSLMAHFDMGDDDTLSAHLHQLTGGNPFYLVETLEQLREAGWGTRGGNWHDMPIPASVRDTVARRLERVGPKARQVLESAAVWGQVFSYGDIQQVSGRNGVETGEAVEELLERNLIVETDGKFQFHHEIIRIVAYQSLRTWRRQMLHKRSGELLEQEIPAGRGPERAAMAARVGQHLVAAEAGERAVTYLLEAGDYARNLYDHRAALDHYRQALIFLRQQDDVSLTARTLMKVSLTNHLALEFEDARAALDEAQQLRRRLGRIRGTTQTVAAPHPLRLEWPAAPYLMDPTRVDDYFSRNLIEQLFSGLVRLTPELDVVPDVAQGWEIEDGGKRYLFNLRDDVTWSDGQPVSAYDFEYAWKRVLDPATGSPAADILFDICNAAAYHAGQIASSNTVGIHALDSESLAIELAEPTSYFLYLLTHTACFPVPRHIVSQSGSVWSADGSVVSNGAFLLQAVKGDGTILLERNADYHNPAHGNVDRVVLSALLDRRREWKHYEADELDLVMLFYPPSDDMEQMRWRYAADYVTIPALLTDFVTFDTRRPPFDDVRVRQALALVVDRAELADRVMQGYAAPADGGFVPPGMPGHSPGVATPFNPARARDLLRDAGYGDCRQFPPVEWLTPKGFESVSSFLRSQWQTHLGLDLAFQILPWEAFAERLATSPPQMLIVTWRADYPDPDNFLRAGPVRRFAGWNDEVYGWLLDDARHATDVEERLEISRQIDRMLMEEAVILPLTYGRDHLLVKPWVKLASTSPVNWWSWHDIVIENH